MKHYELVDFLSNWNVKPPCTNAKPPRTNVKPPYWRLSGDGSAWNGSENLEIQSNILLWNPIRS